MNMTLQNLYSELLERSRKCLSDLAEDDEVFSSFAEAHSFTNDFESMLRSIEGRPETEIFRLASKEYDYALYAIAIGSNRHAHNSLRLFLELTLGAIYFSAFEIKLRNWLGNMGDINWSTVTNSDDGVFSKSFVNAFNADLYEYSPQYSAIASAVYRECSEFVHGNQHTHKKIESISYKAEFTKEWIDKAESVRIVIIFAFACRYLNILEDRTELEAVMLEKLGHIPEIRSLYN